MIILRRSLKWREKDVRGGQFNGGRIVIMEVASLKKGEWLT